ncbi:MAG: hypothetical protein AAF085_07480 [Planctomycetota bacterium]
MAKPKSNSDEPVSLFPFLSILACLIGVLTFIITGVAISQMDESEDLAAVERTEKYGPLVAQLEEDREQLQVLDAAFVAEQAIDKQIEQLKKQIAQREKRIAQQQDREKVIQEAQAIQKQLTQAKQQTQAIKPKISELREQIQQDQIELEKRIEAGKPAGTVVRPSGSGQNLKPHFIECTKSHLILHTRGKQTKVPNGKFAESKAFLALLDRVAKQEKERVIFLLRPDGVGTYNNAARIARERQCRYGKIPVPGEGPLDLSMFD